MRVISLRLEKHEILLATCHHRVGSCLGRCGFRFPWDDFAAAAKRGHPARLVTFNPGMQAHERMFKYTEHQDYLAGEVNELQDPPAARWAPNGLQNHRWVCLDNREWVHARADTPLLPPRYTTPEIAAYLRAARAAQTPVTFNMDVDQTGLLSPASLQVCAEAAQQAYAQ